MVARLKITIPQFYDMTPVEVFYVLREIHKMEEQVIQNNYEVQRWSVKHLWNMSGKSIKRMLKNAKDVEVFPWEMEKPRQSTRKQTTEEIVAAMKGLHKFFSKDSKKGKNEHRQSSSKHRRRRHSPTEGNSTSPIRASKT